MDILKKINTSEFPFQWANLDSYRDSKAHRVEIYLTDYSDPLEGLISMFYQLFGTMEDRITIYSQSWWDFCLDTWVPNTDQYSYQLEGKHEETKAYLKMLIYSNINIGYAGSCECLKWDNYLSIAIKCILTHIAPYSHLLYSKEHDFFFYFHHTGSIGLYYKDANDEEIQRIISIADKEYEVTT